MSSLGETDISVVSTIVGRIRVLQVYPDLALFPRLGISVGITLFERPTKTMAAQSPALDNLQLRDAIGELRLSENGDIIGAVMWTEPHRVINTSFAGSESHLKFTCDLDFWRLEQIERRRSGAPPQFWLQLWPTLTASGETIECHVAPVPMSIPREQWLNFYSKVGGTQYEIMEIQYPPKAAEQFQRALSRTRDARTKITEGEYDQAVALCRNVIEALIQELRPSEVGEDPLRSLFLARTDDRRAKEYTGIVSRLKQLTAFAHHELGDPVTYSREEAAFIVRLTESLLALVGRLASST